MNGASSAAASRSRSWATTAMDTPSVPGIGAGASDRLDSGRLPEPGAGGTLVRPGGTDGGGAVERRPDRVSEEGRVEVPVPGRESGSVPNVGGGTKARRAIGQLFYASADWCSSESLLGGELCARAADSSHCRIWESTPLRAQSCGRSFW